MTNHLETRTIADFGEQWTAYPDSGGFFGSHALFNDFFNPLVVDRDVAGCRVAEIGAGAGRFVNILAQAGAAHIVAVEPSDAFRVLQENTSRFSNRITYLKTTGDRLPVTGDLDYVFLIGVLHHVPDPDPVVAAAFGALRSGRKAGGLAVWARRQHAVSCARRPVAVGDTPPSASLARPLRARALSAVLVLHDGVPVDPAAARSVYEACDARL